MPLTSLTCPICLATLKTKTPVPEGSRVRCPKCKGSFTAEAEPRPEEHEAQLAPKPTPEPTQEPMPSAVEPADDDVMEVVEAEVEEAPPARPARGRMRAEDDRPRRARDEDDEEQRDRPRTRKASKGIPLWVWLVSGGLGLVLLCGCCGTAGVVGWSLMGSLSVNMDNYNKIKRNMTEAQVQAIMGQPTSTFNVPGAGVRTETWTSGDSYISVTFQNDRATDKSCRLPLGPGTVQESGFWGP